MKHMKTLTVRHPHYFQQLLYFGVEMTVKRYLEKQHFCGIDSRMHLVIQSLVFYCFFHCTIPFGCEIAEEEKELRDVKKVKEIFAN